MFYIVGLGNPGEEYEDTRHNVGRMAVLACIKKFGLPGPAASSKYPSLISEGRIQKEKVLCLMPETFMNRSGSALKPLITSAKKAEGLIVIHDDLDMPLGKIKILFNRGSGGHKGVESVIRAVKTEGFVRIKVGISPVTPKGKAKKPSADRILDFIVGKFKPAELLGIKKVLRDVCDAVELIVTENREAAMGVYNGK